MCKIHSLVLVFGFIITALVISPSYGAGKEGRRLSLPEAINLAIAQSEDVKQAHNEIKRAIHQYRESLGNILPHINGSFTYNYYPEVMTTHIDLPGMAPMDVALGQDHDFTASVNVDQLLFAFGKIQGALKASKYNKQRTKEQKTSQVSQVVYETTVAYLNVLLAQNNLKILSQSYQNALKTKFILSAKFAMGRVPKADNIKINADVAMRLPQLKKAQADFLMAMRTLKVMTGLEHIERIILTTGFTSRFPHYNKMTSIKALSRQNPKIKMIRAQLHLSEQLAKIERTNLFPKFTASGQYQYYGQGNEFALGDADFQNLGTIGVQMNIPLWNGGTHHARYQQSLLDVKNQKLLLEKTTKLLKLELANSLTQYEHLKPAQKSHQDSVFLNQKAFEAMQESFQAGQVSLSAVNDAELQLTSAKLNRLFNLYEINKTIAKIEEFLSGGFYE